MAFSSISAVSSPPLRGVYDADPNNPPSAPCGAAAVAVQDHAGRVIGFAWLAPEYDPAELDAVAWQFLDKHVPVMPASARFLRLTP